MLGTRLEYTELHWWYWTACWLLIVVGMAGYPILFPIVTALAVVMVFHFAYLRGSFTAFAVQIRMVAVVVFGLGIFFPVIYWIPIVGVFGRIAFNYCSIGRILKLLPWNREGLPLTWDLVKTIFLTPPNNGQVSLRAAMEPEGATD